MGKRSSLKRRDMLKISSVAVGAWMSRGLHGGSGRGGESHIEEAARRVGRLPRRRLGYSGREVSILIGAGDLDPAVTEAGILCGMNYWHKANRWMGRGAPESIRRNRDAHICQVTVDRVGGSHRVGHFDEEAHVAYVKQALRETGLRFFDDMQLHYGYHSAEELRKERGFVRAFEQLKKAGLVKHICLSQHGYAGDARVPGGQSAAEVLTAVVEDGVFEHAQFIYSYGTDPELDGFLDFARKKGFGTIAMKTARGIGRMKADRAFMGAMPAGTSPHHALARWLTTATRLDAAVIRVKTLDEFTETYSGAGKPLRSQDAKTIAMMTRYADRTACRLCTACQPHCPQRVPIADILRFERYALDDHDRARARTLYAELPRKADACRACGTCVEHCPLHLAIPDKIARLHALLG